MKKILKLYVEEHKYDGVIYQRVEDGDKLCFSVANLDDCPEDAIIGRDLFDAYDYLKAVRYGMELAKQGYDSVEFVGE